jgi:hypothetical protein
MKENLPGEWMLKQIASTAYLTRDPKLVPFLPSFIQNATDILKMSPLARQMYPLL